MTMLYVLIDPETDEIRYVGQTTKTLSERLRNHSYPDKEEKHHTANWLRLLKSKGRKPQIVEIDYVEEEDADEAEILYIREYKLLGCCLTNTDEGGKTRRIVSEDTRKKLSVARKGKPSPNKGKPCPEDAKRRISATLQGNIPWNKGKETGPLSEDHRVKIGNGNRGKPKPPDFGTNSSNRQKGKKLTNQHINNLSGWWKVINPEGEEQVIRNLNQFCKDNGLGQSSMSSVAKGKAKQHKGWKCKKIIGVNSE